VQAAACEQKRASVLPSPLQLQGRFAQAVQAISPLSEQRLQLSTWTVDDARAKPPSGLPANSKTRPTNKQRMRACYRKGLGSRTVGPKLLLEWPRRGSRSAAKRFQPGANAMRRHTLALIVFASWSAVAIHASAAAQSPRQVAAPAEDIRSGRVRLPDPSQAISTCRAAILPLVFERSADGRLLANAPHPLERSGPLTLVLVSPAAAGWRVLAAPSGGVPQPIEALFAVERSVGMASEWLPGWVAQRLELQGVVAGAWNFQVDARSSRSVDPGWLFASSGAQLFAGAWVDTQQLVAGDPIAVGPEHGDGEDVESVARDECVHGEQT
jgi:hypothetical protein